MGGGSIVKTIFDGGVQTVQTRYEKFFHTTDTTCWSNGQVHVDEQHFSTNSIAGSVLRRNFSLYSLYSSNCFLGYPEDVACARRRPQPVEAAQGSRNRIEA